MDTFSPQVRGPAAAAAQATLPPHSTLLCLAAELTGLSRELGKLSRHAAGFALPAATGLHTLADHIAAAARALGTDANNLRSFLGTQPVLEDAPPPAPRVARTEGLVDFPVRMPVKRPSMLKVLADAAPKGADAHALWGTALRLGFDRPGHAALTPMGLVQLLAASGHDASTVIRASHQVDSAAGGWTSEAALLREAGREMIRQQVAASRAAVAPPA